MTYTMRAEFQVRIEEEYENLDHAIARARELKRENGDGGYSVSGEGIHAVLFETPAEVEA